MPPTVFQQVLLIGKYQAPQAQKLLAEIAARLSRAGVEVWVGELTAQHTELPYPVLRSSELAERTAQGGWVAVVLGGDGTMLGAARRLAPLNVPLVGINAGRLGFMTDIADSDWESAIDGLLAGDFEREERAMLTGAVERAGETIFSAIAVNDVVVNRNGASGLVELKVEVDGRFMYVQRADGLIVATPTGSTAYALSAYGPILHPSVDGVVLVPIAPHTLSNRPIVLPGGADIVIEVVTLRDVSVNFDMQSYAELIGGDRIRIRQAPYRCVFLHPPGWSYFSTLRKKLHWHEIPDES
ncbi:MAG: NAD kinase [Thiomonas sp.]|uniref:NAD kinase n=1 Tax=Thiomonas sp. TaxID=2047785 RepID=UPI002A36B247|nr:NAD kinase [Thiomonas sp.]MDY0331455.1 NAD kinase [Thiomonas sp.]